MEHFPGLLALQILTVEAGAAEHLLIYFHCLRYVLEALLKSWLPSHTSSCGLAVTVMPVMPVMHAGDYMSELL